jgi:Gametolysin peptidase M11
MRRASIAAALALVALLPASAGAAEGVLRTLVIRLTWNAAPLSDEAAIRSEAAQADDYLRRVSFGHLGITTDLTPVIDGFTVPNGCFASPPGPSPGMGAFADAARKAAAAQGYDVSAYDRFVYLLPDRVCGAGGLGFAQDVLLAGTGFEAGGFIHELGHTLGLPHAGSARCTTCGVSEYGDPFTPMGHGIGDFSAWEKSRLGWLTGVVRTETPGRYEVAPSDAPSTLPQALVVPSAFGELWIEQLALPQVVVHIVRSGRTVLLASGKERAIVPGLVSVRRSDARTLDFAWVDTTPPSRPQLLASSSRGGLLLLTWRGSSDSGSGVRGYRIRVDGRLVSETAATQAVVNVVPGRRHSVALTAIDRSGRESRSARRTVG